MNGGGDFVKLYTSIVTSSIWLEGDSTLRVWIYMLATADAEGYVGASVGGLAHQSRVSREDCRKALDIFLAPDEDSRDRLNNPENDGRRIEVVDGGWRIINIRRYRDMRTQKQIDDAERQRRHRSGVTDRDERDMSHESQRVAPEGEGEVRGRELHPPSAHAKETSGSSVHAVCSVLPQENREDFYTLVDLWPPSGITALIAEIKALLEGMHGTPVDRQHMGQAIRDYTAAFPKQPSLKHFRGFVRSIEREGALPSPASRGMDRKGKTLAAAKLIQQIRTKRHPQFPNSISPAWSEGLDATQIEAAKPFLARIFADDPKGEGTLLAQLARALEEST
jgi:hypothetical protein